jgi:hypothetical protein
MATKTKRPLMVRETFSVDGEVFHTREEAESYIKHQLLQEQVLALLSGVVESSANDSDYVVLRKLSNGNADLADVAELLCGWWPDFGSELTRTLNTFYQQEELG